MSSPVEFAFSPSQKTTLIKLLSAAGIYDFNTKSVVVPPSLAATPGLFTPIYNYIFSQIKNLNYFLLFAFAVLFVQLTHEFAHWSMSEILGYDSFLTLNSSGPLSDYRLPWHAAAVDMAGPAFTVLSALIFFALIVRRRIKILYPFLLMCFAQRFLASIFGVFAMHNDEARLSLWINLPPHILPLIVCAFLFVLTFIASKKLMIGIKENIIDISVIYLFCFGIILLTQMFHWRLI